MFLYNFAYETNALDGKLKAAHGLEIPFVFGEADTSKLAGTDPARVEVGRAMSEAWVSFATNGDPNHAELPKWTPYSPSERATMIFDAPCRVEIDPRRELREGLVALGITRR